MTTSSLPAALACAALAFCQSTSQAPRFTGSIKGFVIENGKKNEDILRLILEREAGGRVIAERIAVQPDGAFASKGPLAPGPWAVKTEPPCAEITEFTVDSSGQRDVMLVMLDKNNKPMIVKSDDVGIWASRNPTTNRMQIDRVEFNPSFSFKKLGLEIDVRSLIGGIQATPAVCPPSAVIVPEKAPSDSGKQNK